jgi:NTP pyrophosphatase (non-canonical NTP hydrolase)
MFKDAQKEVDDWVQNYKTPYWAPLSQLASLTEEVGEVARVLNYIYGDNVKKEGDTEKYNAEDLSDELADILFSVICLANSHDIDLDEAFARTMEKSRVRDKDRFEKK